MIVFTDETKAFDVIESAQILGLTPTSVRRYLADGRLHGEKLKSEFGKKPKVYITMDEIKRFIKARCSE